MQAWQCAMPACMIKVCLYVDNAEELEAALAMLQSWQGIGQVAVDACIVDTAAQATLAPVAKAGSAAHQSRKSNTEAQLQTLLGAKLKSLLQSVRTLSVLDASATLHLHRRYSDVVMMHRQLYGHLATHSTYQAQQESLAPVLLLADGGQWPKRVVLPHDPLVLKRILPYKQYLVNGAEVVIVSVEDGHVDEKMLMAYVQAYCKKPGYVYLTENSLDEVLRITPPNTMWVSMGANVAGPAYDMLQALLRDHAARLNLSFLLL